MTDSIHHFFTIAKVLKSTQCFVCKMKRVGSAMKLPTLKGEQEVYVLENVMKRIE